MFTDNGIILLALCLVFLAPIFAIVYHFIKLQQWDGTGKKPAFAWWTVVAPITLCLIPVVIYSLTLASTLMGPSSYSSATPTNTFLPYVTSPPQPRAPTATVNPCLQALLITPYHEGQTICVYGNMQRQQFLTFNYTVRLYFSEAPGFFFLCENCYFPDLTPGDCISARGTIHLTTDDQPFINVTQQTLKNCN